MKSTNIFPFIFCLFAIPISFTQAQDIVGELKLKDFPSGNSWFYPYDIVPSRDQAVLHHSPAVRISEGEFIHLWQEDKGFSRERHLTRYNVFMEEVWDETFKLDSDEDIIHLMNRENKIFVLSEKYVPFANRRQITARVFDADSGRFEHTRLLVEIKARIFQDIWMDFSPDSSTFILFSFHNEKSWKRVRTSYDTYWRNDRQGFRITNAHQLKFFRFDDQLQLADSGQIIIPDRKLNQLDCRVDNQGNVYLASYHKDETLTMTQWNTNTREQTSLSYENFADRMELNEPYTTHFPIICGENERLYIAVSERQLKGKQRGTKAFQIINFDFAKRQVDLTRRVDITSTLLVLAEKQREITGLKQLKRFDQYMIRDIIELEDKSTWLVTQHYFSTSGRIHTPEATLSRNTEQQIGEMILYGFDPSGKIQNVMIVPSAQRVSNTSGLLGNFYHMKVDRKTGMARLLIREGSEEDYRSPERIYYRKINLETGQISDRIKLYEGRRREQYFLKDFTIWLNKSLVSFITLDGLTGHAYGVCVNVDAEEEEDDEETRKKGKWWR